jgi:Zn-dependent peptidase ImmA (M78 family)
LDEDEKFDGVSFITEKGFAVIVINKNFPNDRKRFTLAHELVHLLLHNESNSPISTFRDKEKEANDFATEFLMREDSNKNINSSYFST